MTAPNLRVVPLGGLGEVGMNCLAIETAEDLVVVDCGIMFPDEEAPGIDLVHPEFRYLVDRRDKVRALVLTHGHEDHIGAVPFLLRELDVPVYGPPLALALVRERLREHDLNRRVDLRSSAPGVRFGAGGIEVEPIRVTHSIPDSTALALFTPAGTVVHSGDFKIDPNPVDGQPTDLERFAALGRQGVALLLSDSTNAELSGSAGSESDVLPAIETVLRESAGRVFFTLFASNVYRVAMIVRAAKAAGRRVALCGRSVEKHVDVARSLALLDMPSDVLVPLDVAAQLPRTEVVILIAGSQGERNSALGRLAAGDFGRIEMSEGDTVAFSARFIPGNEGAIYKVLNALVQRGAIVRYRMTDPLLHVSGHAHKDDQKRLIEAVRPRAFVPIHGTHQHMRCHAQTARAAGVGAVQILTNGEAGRLDGAGAVVKDGTVAARKIHRAGGEDVALDTLRERQALSEIGVVFVAVAVDMERRKIRGGPEVRPMGVGGGEDALLCRDAARVVADVLEEASDASWVDAAKLSEQIRLAVRRKFARATGRKPIVVVSVLR